MSMELWAVILGAAAMLVIQFLKAQGWSDGAKTLFAVFICVVLGTGQLILIEGIEPTLEAILQNTAIIFGTAHVLYKMYFHDIVWVKALGEVRIL